MRNRPRALSTCRLIFPRSLLIAAVAAATALPGCSDDGTPGGLPDGGNGNRADAGPTRDAQSDARVDADARVDGSDASARDGGDAGRDGGSIDGATPDGSTAEGGRDATTDVSSEVSSGDAADGGGSGPDSARADGAADGDSATAPESGSGVDAQTDGGNGGAEAGAIAVNRPVRVEVTDALLGTLRVPTGFRVQPFARGLTNPRMMAVAPDGSVYVTITDTSQVFRLFDANGNGTIEPPTEQTLVASAATTPGLEVVHGIAIHEGRIYLAAVRSVFAGNLAAGGTITGLAELVSGLPDGGQHPRRTLAVGPDENLYISVGSTCNACGETNPESATMLRVSLAGQSVDNPTNATHPLLARTPTANVPERVFASGLRNTLGFDWHPTTNALWGFDQGSDGLGDQLPPEELNTIIGGRAYGWPYCWGNRQVDPAIEPPSALVSKELYCLNTEPSTVGYQAHSSPIGFVFYRGTQFPAGYRNDAFVAFRGSWNRSTATGYKVVRVHYENGVPTPLAGAASAAEDFLTGFLIDNGQQFGRPTGLAVDGTGALLVADDTNGIIYRVSYGAADGGAGTPSGDAATD